MRHTVVQNSSGRQVVWCRRTAALEQAASCFTAVIRQCRPVRRQLKTFLLRRLVTLAPDINTLTYLFTYLLFDSYEHHSLYSPATTAWSLSTLLKSANARVILSPFFLPSEPINVCSDSVIFDFFLRSLHAIRFSVVSPPTVRCKQYGCIFDS